MSPWMVLRVLRWNLLALTAAAMLLMGGCGQAGSAPAASAAAAADRSVLILSAASTQDALEHIARVLKEEGGPTLTISPAGSNVLAQQIIAGAPGDLFLSANQEWADHVMQQGQGVQIVTLLGGQLVMVVPVGKSPGIGKPADVTADRSRRLALAGEKVPAGIYAEQALRAQGLFQQLTDASQIVRGQNVRVTLAYAEQGEVDGAIVYASDARASSKVRVVHVFDPREHAPIVYPLVLLKHGQDRPAVREVFAFLASAKARAIFEQYGFTRGTTPAP